jgi:carboxylesterase type B
VQVDINAGVIIGKHQPASEAYPKAVDIFYGIPYATTGRFQPARPCMPVEEGGVLDARREGKYVPCPMASFETEEGTLRLNIFRPSNSTRHDSAARAASLPVVVFIHGGAYNFSYPLERDLASLVAWAPRDILVVAVAYRLGPLGFMSDSSYEMNLGLRDQRTAIEWVVRWIGAFGGKQDITLMGISAGAHSVSCPPPRTSNTPNKVRPDTISSIRPRPPSQRPFSNRARPQPGPSSRPSTRAQHHSIYPS